MSGLRDGTRLVITGNPTAEETAAVVVALDQVLNRSPAPAPARHAWQVAARLEATGHQLLQSPWELPSA
jgi:hypothetical protein